MNSIEFRRHLHRHPELSFEEHQTAAFIREQLTAAGIPCRPIAQTGILATIEGRLTTPETARRAVVLRADIDALPIEEQTALPYASQNRGVMHACGHDLHAAMLFDALLRLHAAPDFAGVVLGLFQPAEECNPGGASVVLAEEPFADYEVVAVVGQHVDWQLEVGEIGLREGAFMAASDELRFTVKGRGGHGAMRHLLHDPVAAAAALTTQLLTLNDADAPRVLSLGKLLAEGATNVVPDTVYMEGTLRTFDEEDRRAMHAAIARLAAAIDQRHATSTQLTISHGYPNVRNDAALVATVGQLAQRHGVVCRTMERLMTAEDFGFYTQRYPALFYRLGVGAASGRSHTATYTPSEEALPIGASLMTDLAYELLKR